MLLLPMSPPQPNPGGQYSSHNDNDRYFERPCAAVQTMTLPDKTSSHPLNLNESHETLWLRTGK
jgi:hypothetical protein